MAPTKKATSSKPQGKDIRTFFGGTSQSTSQASQAAVVSQKISPIAISDEENEGPSVPERKQSSTSAQPKATPKEKSAPKSSLNARLSPKKAPPPPAQPTGQIPSAKPKTERVMEVSDDDIPLRKPSTAVKRKKPSALISSSDEDEDEDQKASRPRKRLTPSKRSSPKLPINGPSSLTKSRPQPSTSIANKAPPKKIKRDDDFIMLSDHDSFNDEDVSEEDDELIPQKKNIRSPLKGKAPAKSGWPKEQVKERVKVDDTNDSAKTPAKKAPNWAAIKAARMVGPSAPGSKQIPEPLSPDCLAGLSFVFTGELTSLSRDEAVDLAKKYGGRVVGQPSSVTSYVVLGNDAGPSKLKAIEKHKLKTLNEDEFLNLIATRQGPSGSNGAEVDLKFKKKLEKEQKAIREAAKELELQEAKTAKENAKAARGSKTMDISSQLWTSRYAPQNLKDVCGNKGQIEKLRQWLNDWPANLKCGFKKPGKHGMNVFRAVMISGSPGIGKTTSAHLCAQLEGFTPIELNASDARSKKLVENGTNIFNKSLDGWLSGGETLNVGGIPITDRSCLVMDEVDGMSAGDRGGVGALNALIKKTKIPIICIANDRNAQKMKPLWSSTYNLSFRKPEAAAIRSRIMSIAFKEKMKIPTNVVDQLIAGAQSDIRQVLNMLSTWKLSSDSMTFDEGKNLAKINEKYSIMSPFEITQKMLGPYLFSPTSHNTLGEKMELYFHDHSFVPLFIQENYLKTHPIAVRDIEGPRKTLKHLKMMDRAASSISDGDLVDALIHGSEQHWSLMPLHAVCSTVRPASFLYGPGIGYGGPNAMAFPQWLGQNSKMNKLSRQLGDIQVRMRLKVSGDKSEIRQMYLPSLFPHIVKPLIDIGASAVEDVIRCMDDYFLSKEDWDTVVELGVGDSKDDIVTKKISAATKSSLTRKYNSKEHPIPFHKAQDLGKAPKKLKGAAVPDLEDAFDLEDVVEDGQSEDEKRDAADDDVGKDKLIQVAKKKAKAQATNKKTK